MTDITRTSKEQLRRYRFTKSGMFHNEAGEWVSWFDHNQALGKPAHEREGPHCSTCSCGMPTHEPPVAPMPHDELTALCKRFVVEGYNGDYLENNGFDLAREVEGLTLNRCGAAQPPAAPVRVRLLKDIYDDGQDCHPPGYNARKGEIVEVRHLGSLDVAHAGVTGRSFRIYQGEYEPAPAPPPAGEPCALRAVVQSVVDWNTKYPSSRIYNEGAIRTIAAEMDAIFEQAKTALAGTSQPPASEPEVEEPPVFCGGNGKLPKVPTGIDLIEWCVHQIQTTCDAMNLDPCQWLNDSTAQGESTDQPPDDEAIDYAIRRIEERELSMDDSEGLVLMLTELKQRRAAQPPGAGQRPMTLHREVSDLAERLATDRKYDGDIVEDLRAILAAYPARPTGNEPPSVTSEACDAARIVLTAAHTVTYPSRVSAGHVRSVLHGLLSAYERLHVLYQATCETYCREREAASSQPPASEPPLASELADVAMAMWEDGIELPEDSTPPPVPVRIVRAQWIALSDRLPAEGELVALANVNRFKSDDTLGCIKDIGVLKNSGHGYYWSTHGEHRAMSSEAFTHWSAITEPCSGPTKCEQCSGTRFTKDGLACTACNAMSESPRLGEANG